MMTIVDLVCPVHCFPLRFQEDLLVCEKGCSYPVISHIPRFVQHGNYASSFGLQWNKFRTTQLDSHTGLSISRDRLTRIAGGDLNVFYGKNILEAGCGAGRFTEIMLGAGGYVFAVDLSSAVDANYANCSSFPNYSVCQADIVNLPVLPEQFEIVVCIGVIQHTPDPEATIRALCGYLKPGGMLMIDHYTHGYPTTPSRSFLRSHLLSRQERYSMRVVKTVFDLLWPLHKFFFKHRNNALIRRLYPNFLLWSPVVDYHFDYSQLGEKRLYEWGMLDTHDTLTDRYKHLRSAEEVRSALEMLGMENIETVYAGNGVEARAWKPSK